MIDLPTEHEPVRVIAGDCLDVLQTLSADSVAAVVTDPPYELGFMGKAWDLTGVAFRPETWAGVLRVLKPGGYMLAMGGTRTYHRLTCAVEDAGFEVRDCLMWLYGTGFPKGQGCLKPAYEPIILARKPGAKVAPLGIDGCRIPASVSDREAAKVPMGEWTNSGTTGATTQRAGRVFEMSEAGRWPANVLHDGGDEVTEAFAAFGEKTSGKASADGHHRNQPNGFGTVGEGIYGGGKGLWDAAGPAGVLYGDSGSAARFFYCAKPTSAERGDFNRHPTVKPLALMRWMIRLVCPAGGLVLDPFAGSGSTLVAAVQENRLAVGIELDDRHCDIVRRRVADSLSAGPESLLSVLTPEN